MVVVIDYEAGNLYNVGNALQHLGADYLLTDDPEKVRSAERVILPGVGAAHPAMRSLQERGLTPVLSSLRQPFLGICLGMQLLFQRSEEEDCAGLGVLAGAVRRFDSNRVKVPHMGWNAVQPSSQPKGEDPLFEGIGPGSYFYFVHSYCAPPSASATLAVTEHGQRFSSAVRQGNYWGVQFHPERSGETGLRLLRNFLEAQV
jgi:glutamine amidotransferase